MNILFVFYLPSGGVETLNRQRAAALRKKGFNCHFLYYEKKRDLVNQHYGQTFITNKNEEIQQIIKQGNYSAIIITSDFRGLARFRSLGYKGTLIYEIQGLGQKDQAYDIMEEGYPFISTHANGILVSKTPHIVEILKQQPQQLPTFIFNNCFDPEPFSYSPPQQKESAPILAWIGRIEENKNWKEFLQIGHRLIQGYNPHLQLYIFEDPTLSMPQERSKFNLMVKGLKLEKNLRLLANIPHEKMAYYYSLIGDSGGLLCSTSITESFGYAIVEAMSCRCPVLSTRSDGVSNSIIHNQTGKYYTIGNVDEATREGIELMSNQALRSQIINSALQHIKREFNTETYCMNFVQMLNALGVQK